MPKAWHPRVAGARPREGSLRGLWCRAQGGGLHSPSPDSGDSHQTVSAFVPAGVRARAGPLVLRGQCANYSSACARPARL